MTNGTLEMIKISQPGILVHNMQSGLSNNRELTEHTSSTPRTYPNPDCRFTIDLVLAFSYSKPAAAPTTIPRFLLTAFFNLRESRSPASLWMLYWSLKIINNAMIFTSRTLTLNLSSAIPFVALWFSRPPPTPLLHVPPGPQHCPSPRPWKAYHISLLPQ